ncbi:MAG: DmsE family decaheme c-type cytochrome [Pseudoxanthomonas sp.]
MRFFAGLLLSAVVALGAAAWLSPAGAQDSSQVGTGKNPHNLPSTNLSSQDPQAGHGFDVPPGFANAHPASNPLAPDAKPVGEATCTACHTREQQNFAHTTHALGMRVALAADPKTATCEACHGPGSAHAENPSQKGLIVAFTHDGGTPVKDQAGACLGCHAGGPRDHWTGSIHQRNELSCSDCHNPMAKLSAEGLTAKQSITETCATCHKDIRQQFNRRSHMPLPEGQMACVDCHNPHGTLNASLLKTDTVNETCYQCHAEKRGPFVFEHAPVRDSCLNCHTPHGSNQHALLVAPIPMLCQQCHTHLNHPDDLQTTANLGTGRSPAFQLMGRGCINCHSQVHGSNSPAGARMHE